MANSIKIDGKTITYTNKAVTENTVTFSDGVVVTIIGSVANSAVLAAYKAAKVPPAPSTGKTISMGNAELKDAHDLQDVTILLNPGTYTDRCDWKNLKNVTIDGQNAVTFATGMRAIQMNGNVNGVTIKNMAFKDINDAVIDFWGNGAVKYVPGVAGSFVDGFTLQNVTADNCGTLFHADGSIVKGVYYGLVKNLVIDGCSFRNSPEPRSVVYLGNGMNYRISNCVIDNINYVSSEPSAPNGVHNGILQLGGNGKVFNNRVTNHEGNVVRAHLHSQEGVQTVEIYNNIVWNSKKYGAFEIQAIPDMVANGYKPANAKIYNNIAGHLNTSRDFEGQMVDVYPTGGTFEFYGNVGFELNRAKGAITDMLNSMASDAETKIIRNDGNKYFATQAAAEASIANLQTVLKSINAK